jgi:hypothetical protein
MKASKVLELAQARLARNWDEIYFGPKTEYVCHAVNDVFNRGKIQEWDKDRVKQHIARLIAPHMTLESWLEKNHGIAMKWRGYTERGVREFCTKMQETRHAWVDAMIAEFKAKGD